MNDRRRGEITLIDNEHGFGVIMDENNQDIQFRLEAVSGYIEENLKVTFEIQLTARGLSAVNVEMQEEKVLIQAV
ncbi:cold-shock protein [Pedobacter miscanthi]|nr:cold shock domain-containing protein [Pedobacter miscanthi]